MIAVTSADVGWLFAMIAGATALLRRRPSFSAPASAGAAPGSSIAVAAMSPTRACVAGSDMLA